MLSQLGQISQAGQISKRLSKKAYDTFVAYDFYDLHLLNKKAIKPKV
jgi:hypothetical protein